MNILFINPILYTPPAKGGIIPHKESIRDTLICNFCNGFINNGHNVTLIASAEYKPLKDERFDFDIIYLENSIAKYIPKFPHGLPVLKGLRRYLIENHSKYDIVISSELFTFHSVTAAKVCPDKLMIWQEFGQHYRTFHKIPSIIWYNTIVRLYIKKKVIIVPRSTIAQKFAKRYCDIVSDEIINNSVNTKTFKFYDQKKNHLVTVSQLIPRKNVHYIINKYIQYRKKYNSDLLLYIIGDGEERCMLEEYVISEKYTEHITFYGNLSHDKLAHLLSTAKGFLCATKHELNMVAINESIACGTPILTTCAPYQSEMINSCGLGIAKDNWDENDIAKLISNNKTYIANIKSAAQSLSNNVLSEQFINIYNKIHNSRN